MQVLTFLKGGKFEKISRWMWEDKNYKEVLYTSPHPEIHPYQSQSQPNPIHLQQRGATFVYGVLLLGSPGDSAHFLWCIHVSSILIFMSLQEHWIMFIKN